MKMKELYHKYKQTILYLFFGGCAAIVNTVCYGIFYTGISIGNAASTMLAWLAAVIFAFITNKFFVFKSQSKRFREAVSFFSCRIMTGVLDVIIMVIAVSYLQQNSIIWKLISNVIVTVINYIASKFFIFK